MMREVKSTGLDDGLDVAGEGSVHGADVQFGGNTESRSSLKGL